MDSDTFWETFGRVVDRVEYPLFVLFWGLVGLCVVADVLWTAALPFVLFFNAPVAAHSWLHTFPFNLSLWTGVHFFIWWWLGAGALSVLAIVFTRDDDIKGMLFIQVGVVIYALVGGIFLFSALYFEASHHAAATTATSCFAWIPGPKGVLQAPHVGRWDALYVAVGILTTAGTGTLQPASEYCRHVAIGQMTLDFSILGVAVAMCVARLASTFGGKQSNSPPGTPQSEDGPAP